MLAKLVLIALVSTVLCDVELKFKNESPNPVFVQLVGEPLSPEPFILDASGTQALKLAETWVGRIWGRTDCLSVEDCAAVKTAPSSLIELNARDKLSFYDISLVDGFNINLAVEPDDGHGDGSDYSCKRAECPSPILEDCPKELQVMNGAGDLIGCQSACAAFDDDQYCCRGDYGNRDTCDPSEWPVNYAKFFEEKCPKAYSYPYDDDTSMFTCDTDKFDITFM